MLDGKPVYLILIFTVTDTPIVRSSGCFCASVSVMAQRRYDSSGRVDCGRRAARRVVYVICAARSGQRGRTAIQSGSAVGNYFRRHDETRPAANAALGIDSKSAAAHYSMACALAQMNHKADAIIALKRAIELDDELAYGISEEQDLKPLSRMPAFIKLVPKEEGEEK